MKHSQKVAAKLTKFHFFTDIEHSPNKDRIQQLYRDPAAKIIADCKKLLTLVEENNEIVNRLGYIIEHTVDILELITEYEREKGQLQQKGDHRLIHASEDLRIQALLLPLHFPMEDNLALTNYRIAVACFYLLVISVCLTLGATFGAWYFGYLTTTYFVDTLVGALSVIGIPASCLGLVSFSLYEAQTKEEENYTTLEEDMFAFCDAVVNIKQTLAEPAPSNDDDNLSSETPSL